MILNVLLIITALAVLILKLVTHETFVSVEVTNINKDCDDEPEISEQKKIENSLLYKHKPDNCEKTEGSIITVLVHLRPPLLVRKFEGGWRLLPRVITVRRP